MTNPAEAQYDSPVDTPIEDDRIQRLGGGCGSAGGGELVVYLMQASQRTWDNLALSYAAQRADELGKPLCVVFGLTDDYPEANVRHYHFMLEGLTEVNRELHELGIGFAVYHGSPPEALEALGTKPSLVVTDAGYLRLQRLWRKELVDAAPCPVIQVEDNAVVPVRLVSDKEEYAAYTIRKKILKHRERFLSGSIPAPAAAPTRDSIAIAAGLFGDRRLSLSEGVGAVLSTLSLDQSVGPTDHFAGGYRNARDRLARFVETTLSQYHSDRNDPSLHIQSDMSPYLHFGQISPREIACAIRAGDAPQEAIEAFLEELIVRRELAVNFVYYNRRYAEYSALPGWAQETLEAHRTDARETLYELNELEEGKTDDEYWNAAMREMRVTGKMHNYMRMYWGKRFLEWTKDPEEAFRTALYLNNKYFLDGRDPNSYAGVAWCFGKHDRPWQERPIFGMVRYMNANGLRRKFDIEGYVDWTESL